MTRRRHSRHRLRGDGAAPDRGRRHRRQGSRHHRLQRATSAAAVVAAAARLNQGRMWHRPEAASPSARARSIRSSPTCARRSRRCRACACSWSTSRRSTWAASRGRAAPISSRCRTPTRPSSTGRRRCSRRRCGQLPGIEDVNSDLRLNNPQIQIDMDRDRISSLGLTVNQVETALYNAYGTRQVSQIYAPNNQYQVILGVAPEFQSDPAALSMLYVRSSIGQAHAAEHGGDGDDRRGAAEREPHRPAAVGDHFVQPQTRLRARRRGRADSGDGRGHAAGDGVDAVPGRGPGVPGFAARPRPHPGHGHRRRSISCWASSTRASRSRWSSSRACPSAGFGALLTLLIFKSDLSLYAFVGVIMLVGLVKKNGIMMVDFAAVAERERRQDAARGHSSRPAWSASGRS